MGKHSPRHCRTQILFPHHLRFDLWTFRICRPLIHVHNVLECYIFLLRLLCLLVVDFPDLLLRPVWWVASLCYSLSTISAFLLGDGGGCYSPLLLAYGDSGRATFSPPVVVAPSGPTLLYSWDPTPTFPFISLCYVLRYALSSGKVLGSFSGFSCYSVFAYLDYCFLAALSFYLLSISASLIYSRYSFWRRSNSSSKFGFMYWLSFASRSVFRMM